MQKARRHPSPRPKTQAGLRPLVCTRFQGLFHSPSGVLFTFPSRYSFAIGHRLVFSLGRWSSRIQPGFHVSRPTRGPHQIAYSRFAYGTLTLCGRTFQYRSATLRQPEMRGPTTPGRVAPDRVWALPFSLAATLGISIDFFSSRYLDVSVPWVGSLERVTGLLPPGCPIRKSPDRSLLAAPRGFSQLAASFVAGLCHGIHRVHFLA